MPIHRRVEQLAARRAHNPEVRGSSPLPAKFKRRVVLKVYSISAQRPYKLEITHYIINIVLIVSSNRALLNL